MSVEKIFVSPLDCFKSVTMAKFGPPEQFKFNQPTPWPEWKERFLRFRLATKLHKKDGDVQVSSLIYEMGRQAEQV